MNVSREDVVLKLYYMFQMYFSFASSEEILFRNRKKAHDRQEVLIKHEFIIQKNEIDICHTL